MVLVNLPQRTAGFGKSNPRIYVAVLSNNQYTVGAANRQTGVFVSNDLGQNWTGLSWPNTRCFAVAIDPSSAGETMYAACGNGVWKTTDGGQTWRQTTGWEITEVLSIALNPRVPDIVYLGSAYGVWKSSDGGKTWLPRNEGLRLTNQTFISALLLDRDNPDRVFIGTEDGILVSTHGGEHWQPLALQGRAVRVIAQDPVDTRLLYAGTQAHGLFRSADKGKTWQAINSGLKHRTVYSIAINPQNPQVLFAGTFGGGVYRSTNGGKGWAQKSRGLTDLNVHALAVHPKKPEMLFAGTINGGIFRSDDGGERWQPSGLQGAQVWDIVILDSMN